LLAVMVVAGAQQAREKLHQRLDHLVRAANPRRRCCHRGDTDGSATKIKIRATAIRNWDGK